MCVCVCARVRASSHERGEEIDPRPQPFIQAWISKKNRKCNRKRGKADIDTQKDRLLLGSRQLVEDSSKLAKDLICPQ